MPQSPVKKSQAAASRRTRQERQEAAAPIIFPGDIIGECNEMCDPDNHWFTDTHHRIDGDEIREHDEECDEQIRHGGCCKHYCPTGEHAVVGR